MERSNDTTPLGTLAVHRDLDTELKALAARLRASTVRVRDGDESAGSGIVWTKSGLIVTNAHVVRHDFASVELDDGRILRGTLLARDPQRDLAVLSVNATTLVAAPIGDSDALRVGEIVVAFGNPLGMVGAMTVGIVHAKPNTNAGIRGKWVQANVTLAPGNSGGPLADHRGRVIGVNSMTARGVALAVPSAVVTRFLDGR